jgi:hypothetical protein
MEVAAWLWFALRLMQAESTFNTLGGWRVRPVDRFVIPLAQFSVYFSLMIPLLVLRIFCIPVLAGWTVNFLQQEVYSEFSKMLIGVSFAAVGLHVCGLIAKKGAASRWTAALLGASLAFFVVIMISSSSSSHSNGYSGGSACGRMPEAVRSLMKPGDQAVDFNRYAGGSSDDRAQMKPFAVLPLITGTEVEKDNVRLKISRAIFDGERMDVRLNMVGTDLEFRNFTNEFLLMIRYGNGYWGFPRDAIHSYVSHRLAGCGVAFRVETASIVSPHLYPWCQNQDELLNGAELHVLQIDRSRLPFPEPAMTSLTSNASDDEKMKLPLLRSNSNEIEIRDAAFAAVSQLQMETYEAQTQAASLLNQLGKRAIPVIMEFPAFNDNSWNQHIKKFIVTHADQNDLAAIRKRAETDSRFCEVMLAKNWNDEVRPILRKHALNGLPLDARSFRFVAEQRDPSLAVALTKLALISPSDGRALILKDHPGVNWEMLVRDACRKTAFGSEKPEEFWLNESAILGEQQWLMDRVASWLQSQKSPTKEQIHQWISSTSWDADVSQFTTWLREHVTKLTWNNELKKWTL